MRTNTTVLPSVDEIARRTADLMVERATKAIAQRGVFTLVLSGGSTPKKLYELLASDEYRPQINWRAVHFFMGDERFVPHDDERSNQRLADEYLLRYIPYDMNKVHKVPVSLDSASAAAIAYEHDIRSFFVSTGNTELSFDMILLGLGSDGHTASLFPNKPAAEEAERLVVASEPGVLPPPVNRITFTFPLINSAKSIVFMAAGADKAEAFRAVQNDLDKQIDKAAVPASRVQPIKGELYWLVDSTLANVESVK